METYRPLEEGLTIGHSQIEGIGLIALKAFYEGDELGITHVADDRFADGYIRTPLGGYINHSDEPNAEIYGDGDFRRLRITSDRVNPGNEVTVKYTLYDIIDADSEEVAEGGGGPDMEWFCQGTHEDDDQCKLCND